MRVFKVHFYNLSEKCLTDLIGAIGVYVLWSGRAKSRPTYIGQGNILKRLSEHQDRFAKPISGYVCILGDNKRKETKYECELIETALIKVSTDVDRLPSENVCEGNFKNLNRFCKYYGALRIKISGCDPLFHNNPFFGYKPRKKVKIIQIKKDRKSNLVFSHDWLNRPKYK